MKPLWGYNPPRGTWQGWLVDLWWKVRYPGWKRCVPVACSPAEPIEFSAVYDEAAFARAQEERTLDAIRYPPPNMAMRPRPRMKTAGDPIEGIGWDEQYGMSAITVRPGPTPGMVLLDASWSRHHKVLTTGWVEDDFAWLRDQGAGDDG